MALIISNEFLPRELQVDNGNFVMSYLINEKGWTKQSAAAAVGNMVTESTINPGLYESGIVRPWDAHQRGYGLVQWTPATGLINFINSSANTGNHSHDSFEGQLDCLDWNMRGGDGQYFVRSDYNYGVYAELNTGLKFISSTKDPRVLADVFIKNYLRPFEFNQPIRGDHAVRWFEEYTGEVSDCVGNGNLDQMVQWFRDRLGKVGYSQVNRLGPNSYDCSSALYFSLIQGGFLPEGSMGWTGSLVADLTPIATQIPLEEATYGDIFNHHNGRDIDHTGVFLSNNEIIHCTAGCVTGIGITPFLGCSGYTAGLAGNTYWRLNDGRAGNCTPSGSKEKTLTQNNVLLLDNIYRKLF